MPYRSAGDGRLDQLAHRIAREPALLQQRATVRREHDALCRELDALAEAARGGRGLLAALARLAGASQETEAAERREHEASARRDALIDEERALAVELADVAAARDELAALRAEQHQRLRGSDEPSGEVLRALEDGVVRARASVDEINRVLGATDAVQRTLAAVIEHAAELRVARQARVWSLVISDTTNLSAGPVDPRIVRARLASAAADTQEGIRALDACLDAQGLRTALPIPRALRAFAQAPLIDVDESLELAAEAPLAADELAALITALVARRREHERDRDDLLAQQADLVAHAMGAPMRG